MNWTDFTLLTVTANVGTSVLYATARQKSGCVDGLNGIGVASWLTWKPVDL